MTLHSIIFLNNISLFSFHHIILHSYYHLSFRLVSARQSLESMIHFSLVYNITNIPGISSPAAARRTSRCHNFLFLSGTHSCFELCRAPPMCLSPLSCSKQPLEVARGGTVFPISERERNRQETRCVDKANR